MPIWDGQSGTNWSTGTNWDTNSVPDVGSSVFINNGALVNQPVLNVNTPVLNNVIVTAGSLTVAATLNSISVQVGTTGSLTINVGQTVNSSNFWLVSGGTVTNNGVLQAGPSIAGGTFNNSGLVLSNTTLSGGTLNLNAGSNLADGQALTVNGGTVNVNASDTIAGLAGTGGVVDIDSGQTLTLGGSTSHSYAGSIIGAGSLIKSGTGTQTLTGTNDFDGGVAITQGVLDLTGNGSIAAQLLVVTGTGTLRTDGAALSSMSAVLNGATFEVNGNESIVGISNAGNLSLGGTLTLNSGTSSLAGSITGAGGITVAGGSTDVTAALAYTGSTTVAGGTLNVNGVATLASAAITVSAGTLNVDAGGLSSAALVNVSGTGVLNVTGANTISALVQAGGTIEGAGALTVSGSFGQTGGEMAGAVNVAGNKTLEGGIISGTLGGAGATTVQTGITTVTGTINGNITVAGSGILALASATAVSGSITSTGGDLRYANGIDEGSALVLSGTGAALEVVGADAATHSGFIGSTGAFGLAKTGSGNLTLSGVNFYAGLTTVSAGTLTIANDNALGTTAAGTTVSSGATLALTHGGFGITVTDALTLAGAGTGNGGALRNVSNINDVAGLVTLATASRINADAGQLTFLASGGITGAGQNLTMGGGGAILVAGNITTGSGTLTKDGTGTVALTGTNSFTGATTVNAGTLQVTGGSALSDTAVLTVNASGGLEAFASETVGGLAGNGGVMLVTDGTVLTTAVSSGSVIFSGVLSESATGGALVKTGAGTQILSGASTYTGSTTVNGGVLDVTGSVASLAVTVNATGTLQVDGASLDDAATVTNNGTFTVTGAETIGALRGSTGTTNLNGANLTTGNALINDFFGTIQGTGGLVVQGSGETVLAGTNTFSGGATINAGTLALANNASNLSDSGQVTVNVPGTLLLVGDEVIGALQGSGSVNIFSGVLTAGAATNTTVSGNITGAGALIKQGTGTLTLSGTNTYTGTTTINGGVLEATGGNAIANAGNLMVGNGGTFTITTNQEVIGNLSSSDTATSTAVVNNNAGLVMLGALDTTFDGDISGAAQLTYQGSGSLTLTGANAMTGTLLVSRTGAEVKITGDGTVANADVIAINTGTITTDGGAFVSAAILRVEATAVANVNGSESISAIRGNGNGNMGGTLAINGAATVLTLNASTADSNITGSVTGNGRLTVAGGITSVTATGNVQTLVSVGAAGSVSNAGTMAGVSSAGTFTNSGTVTGNVTVSGGQAQFTTGSAIADTAVVRLTGGTATFDVADTIGTLDADGGQVFVNATLTARALTGDVGDIVLASSTALVAGGANTNTTFGGATSGAGALQKVGTGTLTLTGANAHTGTTTVNGGVLNVTGSLASQTLAVNAGGSLRVDGAALANSARVTLNGTGKLELTGDEVIGALSATGAGATVSLAGHALSLGAQTGGLGALTFAGSTAADRVKVTLAGGQAALSLAGVGFSAWTAADRVTINGNGLANVLVGDAGTTVLNGGLGNDTMLGGAGNDTYVVNSTLDRVYETTTTTSGINAGGIDTVQSSVTLSLNAATGVRFVERLTLTGTANINGTGNALANSLTGNAGNNVLDGGLGNDTMLGGAGNDTYVVNSAIDRVFETTTTTSGINAGGIDTVQSSVTLSLNANAGVRFVERLTLTGTANINGTGNALANSLTGNAGNNVLNGGLGNDTMTGGAGSDIFVFNTAPGAGNIDRIMDFSVPNDTIRLDDAVFVGLATGRLAASAFAANLTGTAVDGLDRIIYETDTGRLYFDADGSGAGARIQFATLGANLVLTNADFFLF